MAIPGEIPQAIGRAYVQALVGCMELAVGYFRRTFEVESTPDKLMFSGPTDSTFSFDVSGIYAHPYSKCEVFIESKGHKDGSKVFEGYKEFLAKAYITTVLYSRHRNDLFWFLTNVPFGSSIGRSLTSPYYIQSVLSEEKDEKISSILGSIPLDLEHIISLSGRLSVCIFTDSFIRIMGVSYPVKPGENILSILKILHGGRIPSTDFTSIVQLIVEQNRLGNPNKILAGKRLLIPWYGIKWD